VSENQDRERAWAEWLRAQTEDRWTRESLLNHRATFFAGWQAAMLRALEVTAEGARDAEAEAP
jgi:hypothetical protein